MHLLSKAVAPCPSSLLLRPLLSPSRTLSFSSSPPSFRPLPGASHLGSLLSRNGFLLPHVSPKIVAFSAYNFSTAQTEVDDAVESAKRAQVSKRLESVARYFRQLGTLGFWGQLVCTVVSAVILAFSVAINGRPTSQATFYLTAGGITLAFLSVFWSFGYIRLSKRLQNTIHDLKKAPPRAEVVDNLKKGVIINLLGMGLTLLGMEATVGALVAKSLTSTAGPYLQGTPPGYSPVLALDVFLVQQTQLPVEMETGEMGKAKTWEVQFPAQAKMAEHEVAISAKTWEVQFPAQAKMAEHEVAISV